MRVMKIGRKLKDSEGSNLMSKTLIEIGTTLTMYVTVPILIVAGIVQWAKNKRSH